MKSIRCDISTVTRIHHDTLLIDIDPNKNFEAKDFLQIKQAAKKIGKGQAFYNIINVGVFTVPDHESRNMSACKSACECKLADAFVIHSASQKLIGNFYMRFHKPIVPTRFFSSLEEAESWIGALKCDVEMAARYA